MTRLSWGILTAEAPNGSEYEINLTPGGLSFRDDATGRSLYQVPERPHIFIADYFHLLDPSNEDRDVMNATNVTVLRMHGHVKDDLWVPKPRFLQDKGLTIPRIIKDYEVATGGLVDAVLVCRHGEDETAARPIDDEIGHPVVQPQNGRVATRVYRDELGVTAHMAAEFDGAKVLFEQWRAFRGNRMDQGLDTE